ncbi:MAG: hypothetical protein V3R24_02780, partial [Gemmatimonadales bacterium]
RFRGSLVTARSLIRPASAVDGLQFTPWFEPMRYRRTGPIPVVASKSYAEPEALPRSSSASAPTIAVASLIATEKPKMSGSAPSSGSSLKS